MQVCGDPGRDTQTICVVEEPSDLMAVERSGEYKGLYHVLHGAIFPLNGVGPDALKIKELMARIQANPPAEIIVATNATRAGMPPPSTWPSLSSPSTSASPASPAACPWAERSSTPTPAPSAKPLMDGGSFRQS